jgi:hypothetical protein
MAFMTILGNSPKNPVWSLTKPARGGLLQSPMIQHVIDAPHFFPGVPVSPQKLSFFSLKLRLCSPWAIVNIFLPHDHAGVAGAHDHAGAYVAAATPWVVLTDRSRTAQARTSPEPLDQRIMFCGKLHM